MNSKFDNVSLCMQPDCGNNLGELPVGSDGRPLIKKAINKIWMVLNMKNVLIIYIQLIMLVNQLFIIKVN
jgi:hypothetical protein